MGPLCHRHRYGYIFRLFKRYIYFFFAKIYNYIANVRRSKKVFISLFFEARRNYSVFSLSKCKDFIVKSFSLILLRSSPRPISIGQLHTLLRFHLRPIYLVVFKGSYFPEYCYSKSGISYLEASFTLRCFQRLSQPHSATLLCRWRDNRCTVGAFIPVLSY